MAWDKTRCYEGILAPDLNDDIRDNQEAIEADLNREHQFSTGGTPADQIIHRQGSARCFWQATAPATRIDGSAFTSDDLGLLWADLDNNQFNILTAITPTWTNISVELFATFLAAVRTFAEVVTFEKAPVINLPPSFTAGVCGPSSHLVGQNEADDDTVNLIRAGRNEADDADVPQIPDAARLASSAAPTENTQIANKKYVDDQIQTYTSFGAWASKSAGTVYEAATDGFVTAYSSQLDASEELIGYTDGNADPTGTIVARSTCDYGSSRPREFISFPVRKGDFWKVTVSSGETATVKWLPIGA